MMRPGQTEIVTFARDPNDLPGAGHQQNLTDPQCLSQIGYMSQLQYSFTNPGGPDQLSFLWQRDGRLRTSAVNPTRIIRAYRGATCVWEGEIDEPDFTANAASGGGAQVTAHGVGTAGANFLAKYAGAWSNNPDLSVNNAISAGLRWINPGTLNSVSGIYLGQKVDSGAQTITALMNLTTTRGNLTWYVSNRPRGNVVAIYPIPSTPTHILVATSPVSRNVFGFINSITARYQNSFPLGRPPGFTTTTVQNTDSVNRHGLNEAYIDLSSSGWQLSVTPINNALSGVLSRYTSHMWGGPFTVQYGQLLNMGGQPVDLGMQECANMVCRVILADYAQGGQLSPGPITFAVGSYTYFDDSMTAQIQPYLSNRSDINAALSRIHFKPTPGPKVVTERITMGLGHHKHHH